MTEPGSALAEPGVWGVLVAGCLGPDELEAVLTFDLGAPDTGRRIARQTLGWSLPP